jgi:hypothetical protein
MEWKTYWHNIVKRYRVKIEGWPSDIPFKNLSDSSSTYDKLETLLRKWRCGAIYWKKITQEELEELDCEHDRQIERGDIEVPAPHHRCSDLGQKRKRSGTYARDMDDGADNDEWGGIPTETEDSDDGDFDARPTKRATHGCRTRKGPISSDFIPEED